MTSTLGSEQARRIVVGVDGSASSRGALAWAAQQAELTSVPLMVITTWQFPTSYGYPAIWPEDIDFAADAKSVLEEAVNDVVGPNPKFVMTTEAIEGHPALVLVDESQTAALVVVGSRGHGEFAGMLLGSVSEFVSTHAHCPVLIIRGTSESDDPPKPGSI